MTKRTLVLMRHAKSSWETDDTDLERPLSARGERDAEAAGRLLAERGLAPDVVLLSPAVRARGTWDGVRAGGLVAGDVRTVDDLYYRDADAVVAAVREVTPEAGTVMVIGHAPTIPETVDLVAERSTTKEWFKLDTKFPTAGIAIVAVDGDWTGLATESGRLLAFEVPRG